jgi:ADP-ribose diphosphatase
MTKDRKKPQILETDLVASSQIFDIERVHLRFHNGVERHYERMRGKGSGAVMMVPLLDANTVLLGSEYAVGTERYELTFPKGLVERGEQAIAAANRELQEEIGFAASKLTFLSSLSLSPGYFPSKMSIFLAEGLYESRLEGDEPEPIELVQASLNDVESLLKNDCFNDARSIAALFLAQRHLQA